MSECDHCKEILKEGLYRKIIFTRTTNFSQDLKTYFQTDQFKVDLKDGKWGASLGVVIDEIPIDLAANASNVELTAFQTRVSASTFVTLKNSTFDQLQTSIPDPEIARIYKDCLIECDKKGFRVYTTLSDRNATFFIRYDPDISTDPMPEVKFFDVVNGFNIKNAPNIGDSLRNETIVFSNRDPEKDLVLMMETTRGQVTARVPAQASGFNKDLPVGTVIQSYLNFQQFAEITKNNEANPDQVNIWTSKYSKWAPCDGRTLPDSYFFTITQSNAPDIRGKFLRGLNVLDPQAPTTVPNLADNQRDPQADRQVASFQDDMFKQHKHDVRDTGHTHSYREPGSTGSSGVPGNPQGLIGTTTGEGKANIVMDPAGGDETRPKNIAIFFYIRIN